MQAPSDAPTAPPPGRSPEGELIVWDAHAYHEHLAQAGPERSLRSTERALEQAPWLPAALPLEDLRDETGEAPVSLVVRDFDAQARRRRTPSLVLQWRADPDGHGGVLMVNDGRMARRWCRLEAADPAGPSRNELLEALEALLGTRGGLLWPHGAVTAVCRGLVRELGTHERSLPGGGRLRFGLFAYRDPAHRQLNGGHPLPRSTGGLAHLDRLEAESIQIIREVAARAEKPVMLYSGGKDSTVMLHLARKAFHPAPPPFPLMHVDTRWEFRELYDFRDAIAAEAGMELIVFIHPDGPAKDINPFDHGSALHTDVMKTQALKLALDEYGFDVAFGGARRDEEKSRAKERVFSFRTRSHRWDPRNQRPELWRLYNAAKAPAEGIRVFPLSNWTEYDVWQYIYREQLAVVPLYFAAERPTVVRDGTLIVVGDDRMRLFPDETMELRRVRFRTLGCYPLTGAIESDAADLESIVLELIESRSSERQGRLIDNDPGASMEKKKQEGYF